MTHQTKAAKKRFGYAYDPSLKRTVVFQDLGNGYAKSIVTGTIIKIKEKKLTENA